MLVPVAFGAAIGPGQTTVTLIPFRHSCKQNIKMQSKKRVNDSDQTYALIQAIGIFLPEYPLQKVLPSSLSKQQL